MAGTAVPVGYWIWYLLVTLLAWAFKLPWIALLVLPTALGRRWIPDPFEWIRNVRRVHDLRGRIEAYPADVVARRDLARVYLGKLRARQAVRLLEEAIAKGLADPEAFYLLGVARARAGDPDGSLGPFVKSVEKNPRLLLGDPYFAAADALVALGRLAEAEDALDRGLAVNSSRVDGHVALGRVRAGRGDREGARRAFLAAVGTWHDLPEFLRWKSLGSYFRARFWLLRR